MARVACLFSVEYYDTVEHPLPGWDKIPFGLGIVAACLERAGHDVRCWVVCPATKLDRVAREIVKDFGCQMITASAVSTQFPLIARLCQLIKDLKPAVPVLLGGVHATISPDECIAHPAIDAICIGEGEDVAVAWVTALAAGAQPQGIPGAWIKIPGMHDLDCTAPAPFRTDLDELPSANYAHWERWIDPQDRRLHVLVGRGCPYSCTYCSNHVLRRAQPGAYVRFRSPEKIIEEIEALLRRFPDLTTIYLEIETIGASIPWAVRLCDALAAFNGTLKRPILFRANLAVTSQLVRNEGQLRELLQAFRRANLLIVKVGLESGSARIRKEILNRPPYTNAQMIRFCDVAREYGIVVRLYLLIGVPTETPAEALETCATARACSPLAVDASIFYPYPGTKLRQMAWEMGLLDTRHVGLKAERWRVYLRMKEFPRWRVFIEYILMEWRIFRGRRNSARIIRGMISQCLCFVPSVQIAIVHLKDRLARRAVTQLPAPKLRAVK